MKSFEDFFLKFNFKNADDIQLIKSISEKLVFPKNKIIRKAGEYEKYIHILTQGYALSFIIDENDKQFVKNLFTPVASVSSFMALLNNKPSELNYKCITDCIVYKISFDEFKALTKKHHSISIFYNKALEYEFVQHYNRVMDLSLLDSTERYLKLKKEIPRVDQIFPQHFIASYLNVTAVQLSRIRKKLAKG